ncbi:MAG TPA: septal ring lytic transglycosylase RlpA family protein [Stellaceae bacterium]|nr:septal ring lytic transglycosylase RlpA family protein [Stellaceae bacterium]
MPFRQTIGISLALLMASTGAMAKAPEKSTAYAPAHPANTGADKSENRSTKSRATHKTAHLRWPSRLVFHRGGKARWRHSASYSDDPGLNIPVPSWGPMHTIGYREIGQAAWYALVGNHTSSGERLDTVTPTAAHRSLPLGSCAKVTDLDSGRSVIVKINDRGPYNRRFIIDLSPRAADELGMRPAGVAAVVVEPLAPGAALNTAGNAAMNPTVATYRGSGVTVSR